MPYFIPTSIAGQRGLKPDFVPDQPIPLEDPSVVNEDPETNGRAVYHGLNMFVSLRNGKTLVGRVETVSLTHFTVGQSDPIPFSLIESARSV